MLSRRSCRRKPSNLLYLVVRGTLSSRSLVLRTFASVGLSVVVVQTQDEAAGTTILTEMVASPHAELAPNFRSSVSEIETFPSYTGSLTVWKRFAMADKQQKLQALSNDFQQIQDGGCAPYLHRYGYSFQAI
jgi:hypothetical protein